MKRLITVSLIITSFGTLLGACEQSGQSDGEAIQETTSEFINAFLNDQFSRCLDFMADSRRDIEGDISLIDWLYARRMIRDIAIILYIGEPTIAGTTATLWLDVKSALGIVSTIQISLVKEGDEWRIYNFK